jgi:hypothetical protein
VKADGAGGEERRKEREKQEIDVGKQRPLTPSSPALLGTQGYCPERIVFVPDRSICSNRAEDGRQRRGEAVDEGGENSGEEDEASRVRAAGGLDRPACPARRQPGDVSWRGSIERSSTPPVRFEQAPSFLRESAEAVGELPHLREDLSEWRRERKMGRA